MPKTAKKRAKVKNLPRAKEELSAKSAKKVKGGLLPAVQPAEGSSLGTIGQKVKIGGGGIAGKGGVGFGQIEGGLQ